MRKTDPNILIIDSDPTILAHLEQRMNRMGFNPCCQASANRPIGQLNALSPELALLGPSLDVETCLKCIHKLKVIDASMPILVSCNGLCLSEVWVKTPFDGIYTIGHGFEPYELLKTIERALKNAAERDRRPDFPALIGQSQEMISIRKKIRTLSDKDINVLITGETGSGKDLIARAIHFHSPRREGPLVKISCRDLPDQLLDRKPFGFQEGAFSDVYKDAPGLIELGDGGTLFIDGIDALSSSNQENFLRILDGRRFRRLCGTRDRILDMRIVAATNSDLRERLWNVMHIKVSPLRERKEDIPGLIHYFLNKYCFELKRNALRAPYYVSSFLLSYHWPGNVRELENLVRRAVVLRDWNFTFNELDVDKCIKKENPCFH